MAHSKLRLNSDGWFIECVIGRFARGTVLIARHSPRLEFLCKVVVGRASIRERDMSIGPIGPINNAFQITLI